MIKFYFILLMLKSTLSLISNGYVAYCPCMGRFGNQADHFLGALAFSKSLNRTLILPPWVEYRYGEPKSLQIPFDTYFNIDALKTYHDVITMEQFVKDEAFKIWKPDERVAFCYTQRMGGDPKSCNAKEGNPFGPFWDTFGIDFPKSEFYAPLNYDAYNEDMVQKWKNRYPPETWPVLAFTGAPASFPVQKENVHLHKYLVWNNNIKTKSKSFIKENLSGGGFIGIHLRNGQDWSKACQHVSNSPTLFSAPQCVGYKGENGPLTMSMCLPDKNDIIRQIKRVLKKLNGIKYIFVASDSNHMLENFNSAFSRQEVRAVKMKSPDPHLDLAILAEANYFIGNCVSSYTAFAKRERDVRGLPSEFWSFPARKKSKHDEF